eukprot:65259_1
MNTNRWNRGQKKLQTRANRNYNYKALHVQRSTLSSLTNIGMNEILYYFCIIIIAIYVFIALTSFMSTNTGMEMDNNIMSTTNNVIEKDENKVEDRIGLTYIPVNGDQDTIVDCLYTYMQLTDGSPLYLYGILAIHGALIRTKSKYSHNVMLMSNVSESQIKLFHHLGIGTYTIDGSIMDPYLRNCGNCWTVTFYKLFIFNMTLFDKILYLDTDVGIMHYNGIDEIFYHPTPSAVSDRGGNHFELNGGVLLVEPNNKLFKKMLSFIPNVRNAKQLYDEAKLEKKQASFLDNWNSEWRDYSGDQGFLNAFFNSNQTGYGPFYSLHYRYGLLTSSFSNEWQRYLLQHRPYILKNVHFTVYKPWHKDGLNRFRQITDNIVKLNRQNRKAGYQDEIMVRFFVRYWMDIKIALNKCGDYCKRHFANLVIPDDVDKFLKVRPEPFTCYEEKLEFISDIEFKRKYQSTKCSS